MKSKKKTTELFGSEKENKIALGIIFFTIFLILLIAWSKIFEKF
jgi:ABC-type transport system involved in cytochrome c biogenesis permease subunit